MLSTVGYEGAAINDFVRTLQGASVEILIDVRDRAQSRRQGFSKTKLAERLNVAGIEYAHFRELGDPKEGRDAARSGDVSKFRQIYRNVLKKKSAQEAIDRIIDIVEQQQVCLMCYESDPETCHRKMITDKIQKKNGIIAEHLEVEHVGPSSSERRRVLRVSEGVAA